MVPRILVHRNVDLAAVARVIEGCNMRIVLVGLSMISIAFGATQAFQKTALTVNRSVSAIVIRPTNSEVTKHAELRVGTICPFAGQQDAGKVRLPRKSVGLLKISW